MKSLAVARLFFQNSSRNNSAHRTPFPRVKPKEGGVEIIGFELMKFAV